MKQLTKSSDSQSGVVLFIAMVMVLILASLTVTTAQVSRQATKFANANNERLRGELHSHGMENDAVAMIGFMTGEIAVPTDNIGGGGTSWETLDSARAAKEVTAAKDDNALMVYFARFFSLGLDGARTYAPDESIGCLPDNDATVPLALGHVSHTAPGAGGDFNLNAQGHCRTIVDGPATFKTTRFNSDMGQWPWLRYEWLDFDASEYNFVAGCADDGDCLTPGKMANNNPLLRDQLTALFNTDISASPDEPIKRYLNYIGPDGRPEYMMETMTKNPGTGTATGLMVTGAGSSLSGSDPVEFLHRITFAGYAGFDAIDERRRSNTMGRTVIRTIAAP